MKSAYSFERLSSTTGDFSSRVKNLFSSPLNKRKRAMSLNSVLTEPASTATFGVPLEELARREDKDVPFIIRKIVLHVEENGLGEEGLYRVNGNAKVIERLKDEFNKHGDAEFPIDDVAAVGGLLKLFLRQLPDGVVPVNLMPAFFQVQQAHPRDATSEALDKLHQCLQMLPPVNLTVLQYLVLHLKNVAEHSNDNKMTPVSLSIVFGPNVFHCGSGLEALKRQGYSNTIMCRFIQFYRELFGKSRSKEPPTKPRPYAEHVAEKAIREESHDSGSTHDVSVGSHDGLEESYSERSIDEAIQERSAGTLSPTSPTPLVEESGPATVKSPPPRPPPPKFPTKSEPLIVKSLNEQNVADNNIADNANPDNAQEESDEPANFSRRYAKRGMKYKSKNFDKNDTTSEGVIIRRHHRHSNGDLVGSKVIVSRDEEVPPMRTPSPYSWQSSPGTSPPTSPALTPRSSRVISSVIEDSVKQFLFDNSTQGKTREQHQLQANNHDKADVYGLLLPERGQRSVGESTTGGGTVNEQSNSIEIESTRVKLRQLNHSNDNDTNTTNATVVRRRSQNLKKLRNRKSALFGSTEEEPGVPGDAPMSPIHDMDVRLVSVTPESSFDNGSNVEAMEGKVADLVKRYDKSDSIEESHQSVRGGASDGVRGGASDGASDDKQNGSNKTRPSLKAFDMFEKSGIIMGLGSPPPGLIQKKAVSFSSDHSTTPPEITVEGDSSEHAPSLDGQIEGAGTPSTRRTLTIVSEDLTGATSFSNTDEDVFTSPRPSNSSSPHHKPHTITTTKERQLLSTTTSDDVFLSPLHAGDNHGNDNSDQVDGGASAPYLHEFDDIKRTERKLSHLTLDRPKGPVSRKKPKQRHSSSPTTVTASRAPPTRKPHPSTGIISSLIHSDGQDEPDFGVIETSQTGFTGKELNRPKSTSTNESRTGVVKRKEDQSTTTMSQGERLSDRKTKHTKSASSPASRHKRSSKQSQAATPHHSLTDHTTTQSSSTTDNNSLKPNQPQTTEVVPALDLMSLAPEVKQTVKEGWTTEGVSSGDGIKALSRRMHELKGIIREFEADFTAKHGHKPSGSEKAPVKAQLEEYNKLRKQLKSLKEKSTGETSMSQTAPPEVRLTDEMAIGSEARLTKLSLELSSDQLSPRTEKLSTTTRSSPPRHDGSSANEQKASPLQETLNKILTNLATRRKTAGRPDNIQDMTVDQVQDEKHATQKALLNFEKAFGRPQTKADKETMRPLYDRYRSVKKACSSGDTSKRKEASLSMMSFGGLEVTAESLPSVTMLQSSMMSQSLTVVASNTVKNGADIVQPITGTVGDNRQKEPRLTSKVDESQGATGEATATSSEYNQSRSGTVAVKREEDVKASVAATLMNSEELSQTSLGELKKQHGLLMARKKEIRKILKDFESEFQAKNGRPVQKQDRKPKQAEYSDYKDTKARLKVVDTLMLKHDPQRTV